MRSHVLGALGRAGGCSGAPEARGATAASHSPLRAAAACYPPPACRLLNTILTSLRLQASGGAMGQPQASVTCTAEGWQATFGAALAVGVFATAELAWRALDLLQIKSGLEWVVVLRARAACAPCICSWRAATSHCTRLFHAS